MKNKYKIKIKSINDTIGDLQNKYSSLLNKDVKELYFLYNGKNIPKTKKILEINKNEINIFVYDKNEKKNSKKELNNIICTKCKNLSLLINDDSLLLVNKCNKNDHIYNYTSINPFIKSQFSDEAEAICIECKNSKKYYNKFYINSNNYLFCPLCADIYSNDLIDYDFRFCICNIHKSKYVSYCKKCDINLCIKCENDHINHKIKLYKNIIPNKARIKELEKEYDKFINLQNEMKNIRIYFDYLISDISTYLNKRDIIFKYIMNNKLDNYENIMNTLTFNVQKFIENNDYYNYKMNDIINLYNNRKSELSIKYKFDKNNENIFG